MARADGHRKKVIGATLIAVGSVLDAATTALTFTGLARGGWSFTPNDSTDTALLWTGVAGNFALDTMLDDGNRDLLPGRRRDAEGEGGDDGGR